MKGIMIKIRFLILLYSIFLFIIDSTALLANESVWVQTNGPVGGFFQTIEIDPANPDILYAGGRGGGLYKTTDGGNSWNMMEQIVAPSKNIQDIIVVQNDPQIIYAQTNLLYKSTDGGVNWSALDQFGGITSVSISIGNPSILIAGTAEGKVYYTDDAGLSWVDISGNLPGVWIIDSAIGGHNDFWVGTANRNNGQVYHTTNGGSTWSEVDIGKPADTEPYSIFIDPQNTNIVYVGLYNIFNEPANPQDSYLFLTTNGGSTWSPLTIPLNDSLVSVMGTTVYDNTLYAGVGDSVYKSIDNGQSWSWIGPPGRNGDMYDIAVDPRNKDVLYLPRQENGIVKSINGGNDWISINQGLYNVSVCLLDSSNFSGNGMIFAASALAEGTFKTTDFGNTWINVTDGGITHPWADEMVFSPHDPDTVWEVADVAEVFQTTDGGETWDKIINPYGKGFRFGSIYALAPAPSESSVIYALKNGFGIFKSTDGGVRWDFLNKSNIDYTYSIAVHPNNHNIVYSGYQPKPFEDWSMVRQTDDGGASWRTALHVSNASAITSVAIDPNSPDTVYAGSTGKVGQIWASYNAGDDWRVLNEHFNFTNIHVLTTDPNNPDIAYAGVWGGGTFKTEDGGKSWGRLSNDPTTSASAILVDPTNSNIIYLADRTSPRIYRTTNGGATWETYFSAGESYYRVLAAALAPNNPNIMYVSIFGVNGPFTGDLFRIEAGNAEIKTGDLPYLPLVIAIDPVDADTIYAILHAGGIYKTKDGGLNWRFLSSHDSGLPQSPEIGYNNLVIDPANSNVLYLLGGNDIVNNSLSPTGADPSVMYTVYKSIDGGINWINLNDGNLGTISNSIKGLAISPVDQNVLFIGTLNGIFRSKDSGSSWSNISAGLGYRHTAGIGLSNDGSRLFAPLLGGGVYAGDVGTVNYDVNWDENSNLTVDIFHIQLMVDPTDSLKLYASAYPGGVFKSIDGGQSWTESNFGMATVEIDDPNHQGYYAFAIAPSKPDLLYLGLYGCGMYKSEDGSGTWRPINGLGQTMRGKPITALVVDPDNANIVYVATEDSIYRTIDGGLHWSAFNNDLYSHDIRTIAMGRDKTLYAGSRGYELFSCKKNNTAWYQVNAFGKFGSDWSVWDRPLYQYTSLLFHPINPEVIYIGTFPAGIYKSTDGGNSWLEKNVGWTNDGAFTLVFHPENPQIIYAGTYNGVNRSIDGGAHWEMWDNGWPDEQWVFSIAFDSRDSKIMYACSKNGENKGNGDDGFHGTVMKSLDGGASWFPITSGLNIDQEFYNIIVDEFEPNTLYLATQREGVFISNDTGSSWQQWNDGLTNAVAGTNGNNVTDILVLSNDGRHLFFGSAGSGVFRRPTVSNIDENISIYPVSIDFGSIDVNSMSVSRTINISNTGVLDLAIGSISISGKYSTEFNKQNDECSNQTIAPLRNCTFDIKFIPTSIGLKVADITIPSNDTETKEVTVPLNGAGVVPDDGNSGDDGSGGDGGAGDDGGGGGGCFTDTLIY